MLNAEDNVHKPVLLEEVCEAFGLLAPLNNQVRKEKPLIIDATIGTGGHSAELIKRGAYIFGIDADEKMIKIAAYNLKRLARRVGPPVQKHLWCGAKSSGSKTCPTGDFENIFKIVKGNFADVEKLTREYGIKQVDGILLDLGISSYHYLFNKGFSFQNPNSPLDMRLSDEQNVTAADLLNALPKAKLDELFEEVLPYIDSRKVSKAVVGYRLMKKIETVADFTYVLDKVYFGKSKRKINVYTLPFMALRMAVNCELDNLRKGLESSFEILKRDGVLVVISFHSGEDRIVKRFFDEKSSRGEGMIEKEVIIPKSDEVSKNPRARSAKLREIKKNK